MKSLLLKAHRALKNLVFIPVNVGLIILDYYLRRFFLGSANSILYLSRIDKRAIIPLLRMNRAAIGNNCDIETGIIFHNCTDFSNLTIGNNCHVGKNVFFDLRDKVIIKDNCTISMGCSFITHIDTGKSNLRNHFPSESKPVTLVDNVYLGANATVLMGVVIHEGSFVAAGSLVNEDVEAGTLVGGVPAKKLKSIVGD